MTASRFSLTSARAQPLSAGEQERVDKQLWKAAGPWRRGEEGDAAAIVRLVGEGASSNAKNKQGDPAVYWAAVNGHTAAVEALLRLGADPNAPRSDGYTALMEAARWGHAVIVAALLQSGAAVDAVDDFGRTALVRAARNGQAECARLLLEAGAAVDAREEVEVAERMGKAKVVALLEDRLSSAEKAEWAKRKAEIAAEPDDY